MKQINSKVATDRSADENRRLEEYYTSGLQRNALLGVPAAVYALDFAPDGKSLAVAGSDGIVRIVDVASGTIVREFPVVPITPSAATVSTDGASPVIGFPDANLADELSRDVAITGLEVDPQQVVLSDRIDYVQLVVTATLASGQRIDATRMAHMEFSADVARITRSGTVQPQRDGVADLRAELGGRSVSIPVSVSGLGAAWRPDYLRDVAPVIAKLGCNQGTCHGAAQGKNGFKLSLRGYDAIADLRALLDDHASRRANTASPADSLMLLKATAAVPHIGRPVIQAGRPELPDPLTIGWRTGANCVARHPASARSACHRRIPVVESIGAQQQIRVVATYADGRDA